MWLAEFGSMFKAWYIWKCLNQPHEILKIETTANCKSAFKNSKSGNS